MNTTLNEQRVLDALEYELMSSWAVAKKVGMNWHTVLATLAILALEGKVEFERKSNKNYLFKKITGSILA